MTRFELEIGRRLADLADDLGAGPPPSAESARRRHARMRRTRRGVAGTVLAVVAVVVAVPLGLARSGTGDVAGEPPGPSTTATTPTGSATVAPTAPSTRPTPTDAAWQARLGEAAGFAAQLTGPVSPRVPEPFTRCPDLAADLTARLGVAIVPDGGESGSTEPQSGVCLWATPGTAAETDDPATWSGATVRFMPDVRVDDVRGRLFVCDQGGPCPTVDAPVAGPEAFLVSDVGAPSPSLDLVVPDAGGDGIWVIGAYRGVDSTGPSLVQTLDATALALTAAFGTP